MVGDPQTDEQRPEKWMKSVYYGYCGRNGTELIGNFLGKRIIRNTPFHLVYLSQCKRPIYNVHWQIETALSMINE